MNVIVIGGGPAGMMAAIASAQNNNKVILIEKMNMLGKKLLITGKGRCNITSSLPMDDFIKNIPGNGKFLYSSFQNYTNQDIIGFLKTQGLEVKEERGNRVFPITDKSKDVLNCFERKLKSLGVEIKLNTVVKEILVDNGKVLGVKVAKQSVNSMQEDVISTKENQDSNTETEKIYADKVILATGGKSYPLTGSTGDGYILAKKLGHTICDLKPSLVPLEIYNCKEAIKMQGLSLRNVKIKIVEAVSMEQEKEIYEDFGEMLFTHFGISGPIILSGSAHLVRYPNLQELLKNKKIKLYIDLKPALTEEQLDNRILRDFKEAKNKQFKNSLDNLLPQKMISYIIEKSGIPETKKVNEITKEERKRLLELLKKLEFTIKTFRPIEEAIITSGGINIKEINPKTMESKLVKGLYFAGEIIDVDGYTGGFNLQIAYSTGYTAGMVQ